jgi:hypothetical protein
MTGATTAVSPLRRRMIDEMTLRNLSPAAWAMQSSRRRQVQPVC